MGEEFEGGVCGSGSWWNSTRIGGVFSSSACSLATNGIGSFGWPSDLHVMSLKKTSRSGVDYGSGSNGSVNPLQQMQKTDESLINTRSGNLSIDSSTLQMIGTTWNPDLLHNNGTNSGGNYTHTLKEGLNSGMNRQQQFGVEDWNSRNFSGHVEDSSINSLKQMNQGFQQQLGLVTGLPLNSASYGYTSSLLQDVLKTDSQAQKSLSNNPNINFSWASNCLVNSNEFMPSRFSNNAPAVCSATAAASNDLQANFFPSKKSQFQLMPLNARPDNLPNFTTKADYKRSETATDESAFKRPRIETPSPLPAFKVRKEKLGDRITALQQLVSPFGKTDTASVLHETIECIKFLHDQVRVLSSPYMKTSSTLAQRQQAGGHDKVKDQEGPKHDLKSRGLCLVPISSTFPVASENTTDNYWTPTFGGRFR